jgi:hypothetical protein
MPYIKNRKCTNCGVNDVDPEFTQAGFCRFCATGEGQAPVGFDLETLEEEEKDEDDNLPGSNDEEDN